MNFRNLFVVFASTIKDYKLYTMKLSNTLSIFVTISVIIFQSCSTSDADTPSLEPFESITKSSQIVTANNDFAFSLFKEIAQTETETNYMVSPVSASLALGMVYNGASGETQTAFANVFHYGDATLDETNLVNQNIITNLTQTASGTTFEIDNSLWVKNTFPVKETFLEANKTYYLAEVQNKDFSNPETLGAINNWVSNKTYGKIPKILNEIDPNAVLYAINALYFKSDWKFSFDVKDTKSLPFKLSDGSSKNVDMMSMEQDLKYYSNNVFSSVQLPYKNDKYTMTLMLPNTNKTEGDIIAMMSNENWTTWENNYNLQSIKITMPKFTFSYEKLFNDALANLGLGIAFSDRADFSGMSDLPTKISFVLQKTFIDVNEKGTEAAAVTVVGIELTSAGGPKQFVLDKPFVFTITEKETGSICFMGKVGSPEYKK
ncbi:serpin B [Mariniflexile fucanivorans]|uniref:Serpin B n=1 Tax=Mariniflexile fucanivorans TaxID=264023 RepID=A0A4R1RCG3_9FLAO|nr:serpin family protein [Mariniflexile fucanivorans]TCL63508.1 serpin B [Mariniflexile fucanivorans]